MEFLVALLVTIFAAVTGFFGVAWWGTRQGFTQRSAVEAGVGLIVWMVLWAAVCNVIAGT